ncbi:MAG: GNAT family N-acetyltransferase, partial [Ruminiclostridium sp.]|nr:GNAT family N-acetyltransferase [Ruminiclostridium sp.]
MKIRKAEIKDLEGIKSLLLQVLTVHHNGRPDIFKGNCRKYTDEEIIAIIGNEKTPVLIAADEDDKVMGYAFCIFQQHLNNNILTDIKTIYIDDLCVDENIRGRHIGSSLY